MLFFLVLLRPAALWASTAAAPQGAVQILGTAVAHLEPEGADAWSGTVMLPHRWDKAFPGRAGRARYVLEIPPVPEGSPLSGVYFPRVGNQVEVFVGGELLLYRGALGDARTDAAKGPLWMSVPHRFLSPIRPTVLEVRATVQPGRWGGLATPQFGPEELLWPEYGARRAWRQWGAVGVVFSLALTGVVAAGLWRVNREPVYGYFALCAPFGMLRYADRLWDSPPIGWPWWGALLACALALHVLLLARFALALMGQDGPRVRQGFWYLIALELVLAWCAFTLQRPVLWTLGLALLLLPGVFAYVAAARRAWLTRQPEAIALCVACFIPLGAGLRDFIAVRLSTEGMVRTTYLPLATMLFVLLMGWLILDRYARQARAYQGLSNSLDEKVRQREQELQVSYALLQQEHAQHAALLERQRIMRDIHDGVGSQLVGLLSLIGKGRTNQAQLREHANAALDELRMAVDSMQTVDGDLATVLATLRYRLQPRLAATGIEVDWQVDELPTIERLTPHMILQIQRILLEAFTNILRHAHATRVRVSAHHHEPVAGGVRLVLEIADNGRGMDPLAGHAGGQGMANMQARAQAIGAWLDITAAPGRGTCVRMELAVEPAPAMPATPAPAPAAPAAPSM
ncbi:sensor histidine kinase [Acidovorax facilis]|uniref:sensor histidine kinase n=1 Tax=Acidovorax facilis TaxID=12917 RepID=UPI003CF6E06C